MLQFEYFFPLIVCSNRNDRLRDMRPLHGKTTQRGAAKRSERIGRVGKPFD